jgi:hypothetical protein
MSRASWATSAKIHDKFGERSPQTTAEVLEDYGMESPQVGAEEKLVIIDRMDLTPALAALLDLAAEKPEAIALVIKHFPKDFKTLYDAELDRRS